MEQEKLEQLSSYDDIVRWLRKTADNNDNRAVRAILDEAADKMSSLLEDEVSDLLNFTADEERLNEQLEHYGLSEYKD